MVIVVKIINLVKSEFIKNYSIKRFLIILLILTISSFFLVKYTNRLMDENYDNENSIQSSIDSFQRYIDTTNQKEDKTFRDKYQLYYYKNYVKYMNFANKKGITSGVDWKVSFIFDELMPLMNQNYLIERMKENPNDPYIVEICTSEEEESSKLDKELRNLCLNYTPEDLDALYAKNETRILDYQKLLEEDKYYQYLEYEVKNNFIEKDRFIELLIDKKVAKNTGFLGLNYLQYQALEENANIEILDSEEYKNKVISGMDYEEYVKHQTKLKKDAIQNREILFYSAKQEIKQDISYNDSDSVSELVRYTNTKLKVNQVFHLSIVVMLIVGITSSGIVSNEHSKGTIKNIITAPVRRWKILLSKFIYLILDTYIIWLLGLFIISICAGIKYGFTDLFTPKLLYTGSKVIEVNYYLYLIKNILLASIPVVCFLSILFFLSTISLNTSLTVGVTVSLGVIAPFLWLLSMTGNWKQIVYTPLWYFDLGFILNNSERYIESIKNISYNLSTGIIICLVTTAVLYIISNIIYLKRDIKS